MRILSKNDRGGMVVDLTHEEWTEFSILANAIEGKTEGEAMWGFQNLGPDRYRMDATIDMKGVFGAIMAFYRARFLSNELDKLAVEFHFLMSAKKGSPID